MRAKISGPAIFRRLLIVLFFALRPAHGQSLPPGGDFVLQSANGPIALSDFRGKIVVLYFGYTSCPSVCPVSLSVIRSALGQLSESERSQVSVVFLTVDPERDRPSVVSHYASAFGPQFHGATGSLSQIHAVAHQYRVYFHKAESDSAMGYSVDHSSVTYIVDREGRLSRLIKHRTPAADIAAAIRQEIRKQP